MALNLLPIDTATALPALSGTVGRLSILSGNASQLPLGQVISGTVTQVGQGTATLSLAGSLLTVSTPPGLLISPSANLLVSLLPGNGLNLLGGWTPAAAPTGPNGALIPGTLVQGLVQQSNNGQLQVNVGGRTVPLQGSNLTPGQTILVRVISGNTAPAGTTPGAATQTGNQVAVVVQQQGNGQLALNLGGRTIPVQGTNLAPGQTILLNLSPTLTQATPAAAALPTAVQGASTPASVGPAQVPNQNRPPLVLAEIMNPLADGRFAVRIDGSTVTTAVSESAPVGAVMLGRLENTAQGLVLRLEPPQSPAPTSDIASAILRGASQRLPLGDALQALQESMPRLLSTASGNPALSTSAQQLQQTLSELLTAGRSSPAPEQLSHFVQDGGLHYEAKLGRLSVDQAEPQLVQRMAQGDLKGQLMRVLASAGNPIGTTEAGDSNPLDLVRQTLGQIESQQALNLVAKSEGEPYQLQVPLAAPGTGPTLYLSINPDHSRGSGSGGSSSSNYELLMHLDFTGLGATWIDARIAGPNLTATLYVENATGRQDVRASLPELTQSLQAIGFGNVYLDVQATSELPRGPESGRFHALVGATPESISLVDRTA